MTLYMQAVLWVNSTLTWAEYQVLFEDVNVPNLNVPKWAKWQLCVPLRERIYTYIENYEACSNVLITYFLMFLLKVPRGPLRKYKQWTYSTYKRYKKITEK